MFQVVLALFSSKSHIVNSTGDLTISGERMLHRTLLFMALDISSLCQTDQATPVMMSDHGQCWAEWLDPLALSTLCGSVHAQHQLDMVTL